jgi:ATP-binding cassette subfamily B protein
VVIVIVPVMALLTVYFQNRILHWNRKVRKLNSRITGAFNEGITGAKTTKTLVLEDQSSDSFNKLTGEMKDAGIRAARLNAVYIPLVLFFSTMAVAIVLLRGGYLVLDQVLELATLSAFTSYAVGIFEPIQMTAANIAEFISLQASIERVTDLLDKEPQVQDTPAVEEKYGDAFHPKRENWEPMKGDVSFRDVTFRYPDGEETVLEHFSLDIPFGTHVAIVGETGAGKSTLANLVCRFYEPTEGTLLIDGRDARERSQLWLHDAIGYVLQTPHLFSGTVRENLLMGDANATEEQMLEAIRTVSAEEVIARLEGRPYTPPTPRERLRVALEHAADMAARKGDRAGYSQARGHMIWYCKGPHGAAPAREALSHADSLEKIEAVFQALLEANE